MFASNIFQVEVLGISKHGFWLLLDGETELFVSFLNFPWFHKASDEQLFYVERSLPHHLYWPELDVDLHIDSIQHPEKYPLVSNVGL